MNGLIKLIRLLAPVIVALAFAATASAQQPFRFAGAACSKPPVMRCPDKDCPGEVVTSGGPVVEPKTGRNYFLDYPCDLKKGEKVTFILSLHGGGSYGNWQRHYFPLLDYVDKYRLVVATPFSPRRAWSPADDEYLQNIVNSVVDQIGKQNIKAFWLAGHSQGGQTSNRLLYTDFYRDRVDGWVSLSGGRLGSKRSEVRAAIPRGSGGGPPPGATAPPTTTTASGAAPPEMRLVADASVLPEGAFSHIYTSGQHELPATGLPDNSRWAEKLKCGARVRRADTVDAKAGYVYDTRQQANPNPVWGSKPRPGRAEVFVYPKCENGLVVADIIRIDKGHTEGLEPKVTEEIVKMMLSAKGGKIQRLRISQTPEKPASVAPAKNDYSKAENWLCRPGREDDCAADLTTTIVAANGKLTKEKWKSNPNAPIDCFYVYPTVSLDATPNSDMNAGPEERSVVQHQFARFASQCRPYAPLYRQVTLTALRANMSGRPMAADRTLGYNDVLEAWKYYLEHDNQGRGVVLIGHSQGSGVLIQLIKNEIDGKPIQDRIISALLLGMNVAVPKGKDVGGAFQKMPLCRAPNQTGCVISYVTFRDNLPPPANSFFGRAPGEGMEVACTNPAALGGGRGELRAYLGATRRPNSSAAEPKPWVTPEQPIKTPFVSVPGLLSAECVSNEKGSYLALKVHGDPADPRVDDIAGDVVTNGQVQANWGLHLIDAQVAMGNLVDVVGQQAKAYQAKNKRK